jgi:hypothetical protein
MGWEQEHVEKEAANDSAFEHKEETMPEPNAALYSGTT